MKWISLRGVLGVTANALRRKFGAEAGRQFRLLRDQQQSPVVRGILANAADYVLWLSRNNAISTDARKLAASFHNEISQIEAAHVAVAAATREALKISAETYVTGELSITAGIDAPERLPNAGLAYMVGLTIGYFFRDKTLKAGLMSGETGEKLKARMNSYLKLSFIFASDDQMEDVSRRGWAYFNALHGSDHARSIEFRKGLFELLSGLAQSWDTKSGSDIVLKNKLREHVAPIFNPKSMRSEEQFPGAIL